VAESMRVAVIAAPGEIRIEEAKRPEPGPTEVRVKLEGSGVCASNVPLWEGRPWFRYPHEAGSPGHEGWGTVDAVGDEVDGVAPGDRVAILSYNAYGEYDVAEADRVVRLPEALAGQPFPGECLGCAMNIFARSQIGPGQTVAVVGVGFLGALLISLARKAGAQVVAISRRLYARDVAVAMGAAQTLALDDRAAVVARVQEITQGRGCERVIEAAGKQATLDLASDLIAERGRLIIAGYHQDEPRSVDMQLWNWRGIDVINAHERDPHVYVQGMQRALDAVVRGDIDPLPLYTHSFPLDALGDALEATRTRPDGMLKALVTP
jgi:threonine dehydrogenase-like Zn-dependent dehydrogenase